MPSAGAEKPEASADVPAAAGRVRALISGPTSLALVERLVNRGASAVVTLVMALFVSPSSAGAYGIGMLALTLVQAVGESTLRQIGVTAWRLEGGAEFLKRASAWIAGGGAVLVLAFIWGAHAGGLMDVRAFLSILPLVLVALVSGLCAPRITLAHLQGRWRSLTSLQTVAAGISMLIAVPLLPWLGIAAAVLQTVVAEGVFAVLAGRNLAPPAPDRPRPALYREFLAPAAVSNLFGWVQGQSDRLTVTLLAGASTLGLFAFAFAIARTATEAIMGGITNVLRSNLAAATTGADRASALVRTIFRGVWIAFAIQVAVTAAAVWPLGALLSDDWGEALAVVPLMAASGVPIAAAYCISSTLVEEGRAKRLMPSNVLGLVLAIATGLVTAISLPMGACVAVVRDVAALGVRLPLVPSYLTRATVLRLCAWVLGAALFGVTAYLLQQTR